jgi:hypothetical protein
LHVTHKVIQLDLRYGEHNFAPAFLSAPVTFKIHFKEEPRTIKEIRCPFIGAFVVTVF